MSKTNMERVDTMIVKWHTAVANREHGLLPRWALEMLIDMVTVLVNKAERRWRRKAADVFAENTALKAEIACLKYGTQPQFDAKKVAKLLDILDGNLEGARENEDDCGDLHLWSAKTCVRNLREELGIELEDTDD